ncbi:MAG: hypothetical protein ACOCXP_04275 [Candidatus Dojkabacteria bacterium]
MRNKRPETKRVIFIYGVSGAGKTHMHPVLKLKYPKAEIYDFDDFGVPEKAGKEWRIRTCKKWLEKFAQSNAAAFVLTGSIVPGEILEISPSIESDYSCRFEFDFQLLSAEEGTIRERLKARGWSEDLIQDNINWQRELKSMSHG